jgi:hypothetical protein
LAFLRIRVGPMSCCFRQGKCFYNSLLTWSSVSFSFFKRFLLLFRIKTKIKMPYQSVDETIAQKLDIKKRLLKKFGINYSSKKPIISVILEKDLDKKTLEMLKEFNRGITELGASFFILSEKENLDLSNFVFVEYGLGNRELILEASDFIVVFDFNDVEEICMRACVPISLERDGLENYNAQSEAGNSFIYNNPNAFSLFEALVRAVETFKFPWDFKHIIRNAMKIGKEEEE